MFAELLPNSLPNSIAELPNSIAEFFIFAELLQNFCRIAEFFAELYCRIPYKMFRAKHLKIGL